MSDDAIARAHDLATMALGLLASVGPAAVRGLCVYRGLLRPVVRIDVGTDDALEVVAVDRGLVEREIVIVRRPSPLYYHRAWLRSPTLWMTARGPNHPGAPPADDLAG